MTIGPDAELLLLLDTSAAVALANPSDPRHGALARITAGHRLGLAGHAAFETLSVLTRLPPPWRLTGVEAQRLIETEFPDSRFMSADQNAGLMAELVAGGIAGGAVFDGLVAAAARAHGLLLISCDTRARATYAALGVDHRLVTVGEAT